MRRLLLALFLLIFTTAAIAAGPEDVLMQRDRDFASRFNSANADSRLDIWMSYFADYATIPAAKPIAGKVAARAFYEKMFADPNFILEWSPTKGELFKSGDLGYTVGRYTAKRKDKDGKFTETHGTYITVWEKQEDGTWKIVCDTGSRDAT